MSSSQQLCLPQLLRASPQAPSAAGLVSCSQGLTLSQDRQHCSGYPARGCPPPGQGTFPPEGLALSSLGLPFKKSQAALRHPSASSWQDSELLSLAPCPGQVDSLQ